MPRDTFFVTAVKLDESWRICWAHTADAKASSSWVYPAAEFPSHGKWLPPLAPRWMHSSYASSAHPVAKSSPWAHWPPVDASWSTTTSCGRCESHRNSCGMSPNVKAAN